MNKKILAVLLALFLTACGGGGSLGSGGSNNSPSLDPAKEVRRIGAITKAALDFALGVLFFTTLFVEFLFNKTVFQKTSRNCQSKELVSN